MTGIRSTPGDKETCIYPGHKQEYNASLRGRPLAHPADLPDLNLSKTAIHKILFTVRATLPENDPDRKYLPFYWSNYGPYSEVVESSVEAPKGQGILREERAQTGKSLLVLNSRPDPFCVREDASAVIGRVVREIDPYHMEAFVHRIYRDYAPYEFRNRYKVDFLVPFRDYCASHPEGQRTLNRFLNESITSDLDHLGNTLYHCEAVLMEESLFEKFNDEFTAYVSGAGKALEIAREDEADAHPIVEATYASAADLWYTFAQGVRIPDRGHDKYYNNRLRQWEREYRESLLALTPKVSAYNRYVRACNRQPSSREPGGRSTKILSSLIEGYFS